MTKTAIGMGDGDEPIEDSIGDSIKDGFASAVSEERDRIGRFNLVLFGRTGAGKSSIVNAVFGRDVARTGIGKPVTPDTNYHIDSRCNLGIYDCKGFETGASGDALLKWMRKEVAKLQDKPAEEQLHVIWYLISSNDRRIDEKQIDFIKQLSGLGLPIILVMTHSDVLPDSGQPVPPVVEFASVIAEELGSVIVDGRGFPVQSVEEAHRSDQPLHGIEELLDATFHVAPEGVRSALNAAQQLDLKRKRNSAETIIAMAATSAGAVGAAPIPFADAPVIVSIQVGMMGKIAVGYGIDVDPSHLASLATMSLAAGGLTAVAGKTLVQLIKFVPGVGTVVGGIANSVIAAGLTTAVGYAWIGVCEYVSKLPSEERERILGQADFIIGLFLDQFRQVFKGLMK